MKHNGLFAALIVFLCGAGLRGSETGSCQPGSPCWGGVCPIVPSAPNETPHPAVARIENAIAGSRSFGSGTLVEKDNQRGVVLTCAHLLRDGVGRLRVTFADGEAFEATLLATDRTWDLAALAIAPPPAAPVPLAVEPPRPGEPLHSCGWGPDGRFRTSEGLARGYVAVAGSPGRETLDLSGAARQGDSGGPVLNARGELVAVLWGTDGQTTSGTYCGRIRIFLARLLGCRRPLVPIEGRGAGLGNRGSGLGTGGSGLGAGGSGLGSGGSGLGIWRDRTPIPEPRIPNP